MTVSRIREHINTDIGDTSIGEKNQPRSESPLRKKLSSPTTPPSPSLRYQIPVPSPQLNAAINAIQDTVEQMYKKKVVLWKIDPLKEKKAIDGCHNDNDSNRHDKMRDLFDQLQSSVVNQLRMLVKPVTWNEYDRRYIQFDTPLRHKLRQNIDEEEEDLVSSSSSSESSSSSLEEENNEEKEFPSYADDHDLHLNDNKVQADDEDEEDLLDIDTVSRVQYLRNQVRECAEQTCSIRSRQMERLNSFILKEVESLKSTIPVEYEVGQEETVTEKGEEVTVGGTEIQSLDKMLSSISGFMQKLKRLHVELPEQTELLSETLDTLDHSLKRKEGGDGVILSGTERAILSRIESKRRKTEIEEDKETIKSGNERINLTPEQRFALFLHE